MYSVCNSNQTKLGLNHLNYLVDSPNQTMLKQKLHSCLWRQSKPVNFKVKYINFLCSSPNMMLVRFSRLWLEYIDGEHEYVYFWNYFFSMFVLLFKRLNFINIFILWLIFLFIYFLYFTLQLSTRTSYDNNKCYLH